MLLWHFPTPAASVALGLSHHVMSVRLYIAQYGPDRGMVPIHSNKNQVTKVVLAFVSHAMRRCSVNLDSSVTATRGET